MGSHPPSAPDPEYAGISGLVLAGGHSSRMGKDKATLLLPDGKTFLERAFFLLSSLVSPCHVSCRADQAYAGFPLLPDAVSGKGPAAGVYSGLLAAQKQNARAVLVLACDLPCMTMEALRKLLQAYVSTPVLPLLAAWVNPESHRKEMTAAVYSTQAIPCFRNAFQNGVLALHSIIPSDQTLLVHTGAFEKGCFRNCNTPLEYREINNPANQEN